MTESHPIAELKIRSRKFYCLHSLSDSLLVEHYLHHLNDDKMEAQDLPVLTRLLCLLCLDIPIKYFEEHRANYNVFRRLDKSSEKYYTSFCVSLLLITSTTISHHLQFIILAL